MAGEVTVARLSTRLLPMDDEDPPVLSKTRRARTSGT
jgi:hypothetical protein